jgi:hypothetical protein
VGGVLGPELPVRPPSPSDSDHSVTSPLRLLVLIPSVICYVNCTWTYYHWPQRFQDKKKKKSRFPNDLGAVSAARTGYESPNFASM